MFKVVLIFSLFLSLASCAHEDTVPLTTSGTVKGVHIHAPNFLKLTKDDIKKMDWAIKSADSQILSLSEGQKATCKDHLCQFEGTNLKGTFGSRDIKKFSIILKKSQESKKEEKISDGPVTLRCLPTQCAADLIIDNDQSHDFSAKGTAKVKMDYTPFLLGSFVGGMVGGAAVQ